VQTTTPPSIGARVELHPATDAWMRGDRYGIVLSIGRKYIHLRMDSGRRLRVAPTNIGQVVA